MVTRLQEGRKEMKQGRVARSLIKEGVRSRVRTFASLVGPLSPGSLHSGLGNSGQAPHPTTRPLQTNGMYLLLVLAVFKAHV